MLDEIFSGDEMDSGPFYSYLIQKGGVNNVSGKVIYPISFYALFNGSDLVAAVFLCMKREDFSQWSTQTSTAT